MEEENWLNFPTGDHWLDASLGKGTFYTDIKDIDDIIDEGQIKLAQKALLTFPIPKDEEQLAEWYHIKARINEKKRNYISAQKYSKKSIEIRPKNPRYKSLHEDIGAIISFNKMYKEQKNPKKISFFEKLQNKVENFVENLYQSAFLSLFSIYSRLASSKKQENNFTETSSNSLYYKFECNLEHRLTSEYDAHSFSSKKIDH